MRAGRRPRSAAPAPRGAEPVGVVLAGGRGRRIGGAKAVVTLAGRPLIDYPLRAMRAALAEVVVVAKADTVLPDLLGIPVWIEPATPRHPVVGILHALSMAEGRAVLVCAADMPLLSAEILRALGSADPGEGAAVLAVCGGEVQPLLGRYGPGAAALLCDAAREGTRPMREIVGVLGPRLLELPDPQAIMNVNSEHDLARAEGLLRDRR